MGYTKNKIWIWIQSNGIPLKVISNIKKGTINVYNVDGKMIMYYSGLTEGQIRVIEEQFLKIVAVRDKKTL